MAPFLDERGRRLFTASEARAAGRGGVTAVATATRVARSTIGRGLAELRGGRDDLGGRIRRAGGGRKPAVETQPGLLEALSELVQSAIRGDPEAALLWVSKSQRHLARADRARLRRRPEAGRPDCCAGSASACRPTARPARAQATPTATPSSNSSTRG